LPTSLEILAINSELDKAVKANSLLAAQILAAQSGIPSANLRLINEETCGCRKLDHGLSASSLS
jgi:hypothetical protein